MKRAEDVVRVKEKPYNSVLPYLRSKAVQEQEDHKKKTIKLIRKSEEPDCTHNAYDKERLEILAEE